MKGNDVIIGFYCLALISGIFFGIYKLIIFVSSIDYIMVLEKTVFILLGIFGLLTLLILCNVVGKVVNRKLESFNI